MRFVSLFAGVGGLDLGLERSGWECVGQVEIDKHCTAVLDRHWPNVPKHDDVQTAKEWWDHVGSAGSVDAVVGGFPCQDVSKAGRGAGLAGKRSGLFFDAVEFAQHVGARVILLENVPGLLGSNGGEDFAVVLETLVEAGYGHIEWRVVDSQHFGVAQRRNRLYIVAVSGDWRGPLILSESEGRVWHPHSRGAQGPQSAGAAALDAAGPSWWDGSQVSDCLDVSMLTKGQMMPEKRRMFAVMARP